MKKKAVLEKHIEGPVVKYATERGMLVLKLNTMGRAHWPDRMFLQSNRVLFIEFKRPGEKPTPAQDQIHKQLREQGFQVNVVDDVARGKADIDLFAAGFTPVPVEYGGVIGVKAKKGAYRRGKGVVRGL